jgi:hypothetical protein
MQLAEVQRVLLLWRSLCPTGVAAVIRPLVSLRSFVGAPACGSASGARAAAAAGGARRSVWGEAAAKEEVLSRDSFYDTVVETWAAKVSRKGAALHPSGC